MFHTKVIEKIKTPIFYSISLSRILCKVLNNVGKYGTTGQFTMKIRNGPCALHAGQVRLQTQA